MKKNNRINSLFAFYQPLLTKKQNDYMQLYYGDDYSLGEIAENFNVSRQAVYDNIRRTEKILETYEKKAPSAGRVHSAQSASGRDSELCRKTLSKRSTT